MSFFAQVSYTGSNTVGPFSVPFPYLDRAHVIVTLGGVATTAFTWPTSSSISFNSPVGTGILIKIARVTPNTTALVDFTDGSTPTEIDFDTNTSQLLYSNQETVDQLESKLGLSALNLYDAGGLRILNVGTGILNTDAANVGQVSASVASSAASAAAAASSASTAAGSASSATSSATTASAAATNAAASAASLNIRTINSQAGSYTVVPGDRNKLVEFTGSGGTTFALTAAATMGAGYEVQIKNSGTGTLVVDPAGAELVDGVSTLSLTANQAVVLVCTGTAWRITLSNATGAGSGTVTAVDGAGGVESSTGSPVTTSGSLRATRPVSAKSANYTAVAGDRASIIKCTAALTLSLAASATLGAGWFCTVKADNNGAVVTIDPNASEQINGQNILILAPGDSATIVCDGANFTAVGTATVPTLYQGSGIPKYTGATTLTLSHISCRDSLDNYDMVKTSPTTLDISTINFGGINVSGFLPGTVTVTAGMTAVTFTNSQTGVFQPGDVVKTAGGQARRIVSGSGLSWVVESPWTSSEAAVNSSRGGLAPNTHYNVYAVLNTNGSVGLVATTRNAAAGDGVDLPFSYGIYRQLRFGIRTDGSSILYPFFVAGGWPGQPRVLYNLATSNISGAGTANVISGGTATSFTTVDLSAFVPPISRAANLRVAIGGGGTLTDARVRQNGTGHEGSSFGSVPGPNGTYEVATDSSQQVQYRNGNSGSSTIFIDVLGYVVTEVI